MRRSGVASGVALLLSVAGCASSGEDINAAQICALLHHPTATPDELGRRGGLAQVVGDSQRTERSNVIVYVEPGQSDLYLEEIAVELELIDDAEVVTIVDQDETYDEFSRMFEDDPDLVDDVTPDVLPPSVRLRVTSDGALGELRELGRSDSRIYEVVALTDLAGVVEAAATQLAGELEELDRLAIGDLHAAVAALRGGRDLDLQEMTQVVEAVATYDAEHCTDP